VDPFSVIDDEMNRKSEVVVPISEVALDAVACCSCYHTGFCFDWTVPVAKFVIIVNYF
jgi:hypothetical protein